MQSIGTDYCGVFKIYFYKHLFAPHSDSRILEHKNLTGNNIQLLLSKLFSLDQNDKESLLK